MKRSSQKNNVLINKILKTIIAFFVRFSLEYFRLHMFCQDLFC
ncbi:hypothetical protein EMIT079MI2_140005 [Bacillus sp. IT-79MI2]